MFRLARMHSDMRNDRGNNTLVVVAAAVAAAAAVVVKIKSPNSFSVVQAAEPYLVFYQRVQK